ncbi:hypothetical protein SAMN02745248_02145 [Hathewaya proteolytica DSM 3090]|uniref:Uncharacterized protein n=1 Tax=Hathewaya proteolytica DSM 3090 TaxID=1121331 RepID=A0A1M6QXF9_9CLOT|nr:hypothetical protein [Hathewaya proteolytica]SHK24866.1 hypothetical protein SAMN02745248_02145 [Hathewaya proteolytica DSM 3090]
MGVKNSWGAFLDFRRIYEGFALTKKLNLVSITIRSVIKYWEVVNLPPCGLMVEGAQACGLSLHLPKEPYVWENLKW